MQLQPKTQPELKHLNQFITRTPLLSLKHAALVPNKNVERFESGLLLASQALWQQEKKYNSLSPASKIKLDRSRYKYWLRASTRPTPYGTFAGVGIGKIDDTPSEIILEEPDQHRVALRMDMQVLAKITAHIQSDEAIREHLKYTVNNSLYRVPGGYRYAEWQLKNGARNYHLAEIAETKTLARVLSLAKNSVELSQLRNALSELSESSPEEINSFINELVENQILISNIETCITGPDPLTELIRKLAQIPDASKIQSMLENIQQLILDPRCDIDQINRISDAIKSIESIKDDEMTLLQADTFLSFSKANLKDETISKILQQIQSLFAFGQASRVPDLDEFKSRFSERYEGQSVPLSIALDADLGIGYGSVTDHSSGHNQFIDELLISPAKSHRSITQTSLSELSLKKFEEWKNNKKSEITLTDEDFSAIAQQKQATNWPASMYLMGSFLRSSDQTNPDQFVFDVSSISGPSAANLIGRFTHGDEGILSFTHEIIQKEQAQYPGCILAEIAHCPQERIGNIQFRPLLREFEIPYVGISGVPKEQQIPIDDLLLRIEGNELILWSSKHNKRVIPRLSTAHNFSARSLPVYKFLCDLQRQNTLSLPLWDWGLLNSLKHLPRVVYKNLVLKKARWIVDENTVSLSSIDEWRTQLSIPDRVVHSEGDNELLIDFENEKGRELFFHLLKKQKRILIEEFLFTEENAFVRNASNDGFTNELIIPFSVEVKNRSSTFQTLSANQMVPRKFLPGSDWVYYKIYCGSKSAETILVNNILPFVRHGMKQQLFEKFFFIRYRDDGAHLRIRFLCPDVSKRHQLTDAFHRCVKPLVNDGTVSKLCSDTYEREIERYGADTIEFAETLFNNDSIAALQFLELLHECGDESYRLLLALRSTDMLLDNFEFSLAQKQNLLNTLQQAYFNEFGGSPALQKSLNAQYRKWQSRIGAHMNEHNDETNQIEEAVNIFQQRSEANASIVASIKEMGSGEQWLNWISSYVHMNLNRLFVSEQRKHELLVYHFLEKYYSSELAREAVHSNLELINN
jgi:thiopeptide-type bacteriocin biosynthesis protein